jgi:two-component sensor histidine kinase
MYSSLQKVVNRSRLNAFFDYRLCKIEKLMHRFPSNTDGNIDSGKKHKMLRQEEIQQLFGIIVRKERKRKGLTQSVLAERSNLDNTYISQIERGMVNPSLFTLHKIAWSLDLSEYDVFIKIKKELSARKGVKLDSKADMETIFNAIGNLNASLIVTTTQDDDFKVIYCNDSFLKFSKSSRDSILGRSFQDLLSNGENNPLLTAFFKSLKGSVVKKEYISDNGKEGIKKELELNATSVVNSKNKVENHLFTLQENGYHEDVNRDKFVYPSIEKYKALLKESHHRIKNNLAIIVGIIDINILEAENEKAKDVLKETQLRISSVANIHEMLLEPDNEKVSVEAYLNKLTDVISKMYQINGDVMLTKYIDIAKLEIHDGVTIGLLCNELITNSYKYAFKGTTGNEINLTVKELNEGKILFSYQDNGSGFERSIFEEGNTLGIRLIHTFMEELKAKNIHVDTDNGFKLEFEMHSKTEDILGD